MSRIASLMLLGATLLLGCNLHARKSAKNDEHQPGPTARVDAEHATSASVAKYAWREDTLFAARGSALVIAQFVPPAEPKKLGSVDLGGEILSVAVTPTTTYAAVSGRGIVIVDITKSDGPAVIGDIPDSTGAVAALADGVRLLVAQGDTLKIFGLETPTAPALLGSYKAPRTLAGSLGHYRQQAIILVPDGCERAADQPVCTEDHLLVVDYRNAAEPTLKGEAPQSSWIKGDFIIQGQVLMPLDPSRRTLGFLDLETLHLSKSFAVTADQQSITYLGAHGTRVYLATYKRDRLSQSMAKKRVQMVDLAVPSDPRDVGESADVGGEFGDYGNLVRGYDPESSHLFTLNMADAKSPAVALQFSLPE